MNELINASQLKKFCEKNGIKYIGIFGSHARGEDTVDSDLDLLVQYKEPTGLLTHAKVQNMLEDYFNKPVDLVFRSSVKPRIMPYIERDLKTIYEKSRR